MESLLVDFEGYRHLYFYQQLQPPWADAEHSYQNTVQEVVECVLEFVAVNLNNCTDKPFTLAESAASYLRQILQPASDTSS